LLAIARVPVDAVAAAVAAIVPTQRPVLKRHNSPISAGRKVSQVNGSRLAGLVQQTRWPNKSKPRIIADQQRGAAFEAHRGARRLGSGCSCWRWAAVTSREDEDAGHEDLTTISLELRRNSQRSKTSNVLEAVATVAFEASVTAPSVNPTRVPDLTTVPVAVSRPLLSRTALR